MSLAKSHNKFAAEILLSILCAVQLSACSPKSFSSQLDLGSLNDSQEGASVSDPGQPAVTPNFPDAKPLWESKVTDGAKWTAHVKKQLSLLGADLLDVIPNDSNLFCPNYKNLNYEERKIYWTFFISSMVRFESNFKPATSYQEDFPDSNGNNVVSRGLLQISIESSNGYSCGFTNAQELHDPYKNLSCGIRILNRWLGQDNRIGGYVDSKWRGGARYWAVLRAGDKESYRSILAWSQNLEMCQHN